MVGQVAYGVFDRFEAFEVVKPTHDLVDVELFGGVVGYVGLLDGEEDVFVGIRVNAVGLAVGGLLEEFYHRARIAEFLVFRCHHLLDFQL